MSDLTNSIKVSTEAGSQSEKTRKHNTNLTTANASERLGLNNPVFWYSGGFIAAFFSLEKLLFVLRSQKRSD